MQLFIVLKYTDFVLWMMFSLYNDPYKHGISVSLAFEFVVRINAVLMIYHKTTRDRFMHDYTISYSPLRANLEGL